MRQFLMGYGFSLLLVVATIVGCDGKDGNPVGQNHIQRTRLIEKFESYVAPEQAKALLKPGSEWAVLQEARLDPIEPGVGYFLSLSTKNFSHLGFSGKLVLQFFSGQLMATLFYPDNFRAYVEALLKAEKLGIDPNRYARSEARLPPHTRIEIVNADKMEMVSDVDQSYVVWADERLSKSYFDALSEVEERRKKRWE